MTVFFLIFGGVFFAFSLVSKRIQGSVLTPPILFTLAGLALNFMFQTADQMTFSEGSIHVLAELTLIVVLATDAAQISLSSLRKERSTPIRLLSAIPLIMGAGFIVGLLVFPEMMWVEAALIAAILAPTDAALGASVLADKTVPLKVRQSLNVESGLNDGLALPAVLFFACFLNLTHQSGEENWIVFLTLQLTLGPLVGILTGWAGGHLIGWAAKRDWITSHFQGVAAIALAVLAYALAETIHGNGFISAFIAGLTYGNLHVNYSKFLHEFTETESEFLTQLTFFLFGAAILPHALAHASVDVFLYAILSLTVVRMIPIALVMLGSGYNLATISFMGWFGPRGLASMLFALLILEDLEVHVAAEIQAIVSVTVFLSILLHGMSAAPLSRRLGRMSVTSKPSGQV